MKVWLFYIGLMITSGLWGQTLTGTWIGTGEGEPVSMIFDKDGYITMTTEGMTMGGKKFEMEGKVFSMKYVLQKEGKVRNLDFVVYDYKTNKELRRMFCIVKWLSENQLKICMNMEDNVRPKNFNEKDNALVLTRK